MLKKSFFSAVALLLVAATTHAGILSGLPKNTPSRLEDNDLEAVVTSVGGGTTIDVGDILLSVGEFPVFENALTNVNAGTFSSSTPMIMGVGLIKVLTKSASGTVFTFEAPTVTEWATYTGLAVSAGTTYVVYEDPASAPAQHLTNASIAGTLADATDGTKLYEFGFAGEAGEFQRAVTDTDDFTSLTSLTFLAAFNLTAPPTPAAVSLGKHNFLGGASSPLPPAAKALFTAPTHLQLQGALGSISVGAEWQIPTDTDAYILVTAVPEPSTILVWAGLAAVVGFGGYRRNRKLAS